MQKFSLAILIILTSLLLMQCSQDGNAGNTTEKVEKTIPVRTMVLKPQSFDNYLEVTGTVNARNHINIIVEEGGILKKILIDKGNYAKQGDTLAILENKVLEAGYKQAQAALQQAELDHRSKKILFDKRAISENEYLNAKYAFDAARATYEMARVRYDKLFIVSPLKGLVNNRYYDLRAYANPMTQIFEFIDNDYMKVRAGVAERFLGDINLGTPVEIRFDAYPEMRLDAKVNFISRSVDPQNRTVEIEIEVPNRGGKLAPNMIANVKILRQRFEERIVVPLDALIESESGWHVFIANSNRAKKVNVDKSAVYEDRVLVDGLQPGQQLVVVGQQDLSDGDLVEVVKN
jgi:membrane fusion protein (multidrug efflux system)